MLLVHPRRFAAAAGFRLCLVSLPPWQTSRYRLLQKGRSITHRQSANAGPRRADLPTCG